MISLKDLKGKIKDNKTLMAIDESNISFFNAIAPMSAPNFHEQYYYYNNYYHTVMQVIKTSKEMYDYVFQRLIEMDNVTIIFDEEDISLNVIKDFLGKKIDDSNEDLSLKRKYNNIRKTKEGMEIHANFLEYLKESNDQVKMGTIRIFLKEKSKKDLEKLINEIGSALKDLDIFASIQTNDLETDFKAITMFDNPVKSIMPTSAVSNILMHENASIVESNVSLLGYTRNGVYAPDFSSYKNKSFCVGIIGVQGSGKSSVIKRMVEDDIINNNNVIILDMHANEYGGLTERYSIPTLSFDENKYINGYEIYTTVDEQGVISQQDVSIVSSLMCEIFRLQSDIDDNIVVALYGEHLMCLYEKYVGKNIADFEHGDWFISSDVLELVEKNEFENKYQKEEKQYIFDMKVGIRKMIKMYGYLFNHYTNIDIDLTNSVRFDLSFLEEIKQESVVTAYLTLIMTYIRKACLINEKYCNEYEKGKDKLKLIRPPKTLRIVFEEFGTSAKHKVFLNEVDILMRLTRKSRVGFIFALHTTSDIDIDDDDRKALIQSIFGLCATYIIGQIDSKTAEKLPYFINGITQSDTNIAKKFIKNDITGERSFIACTDKGQKIKFVSIVSSKQSKYFRGGV